MKAFRVLYKTSAKEIDSEIVLLPEGEDLEKVLSEKVPDYQIGNSSCEIVVDIELPLSTVKVADLSIVEFMLMTHTGM